MALLRSLPENATLADLRRTYADLLEKLRPYGQRLMRGPSPLTPGEREFIAAFVSGVNSCRYCHGAHSLVAHAFGVDEAVLANSLDDIDVAPDRCAPQANAALCPQAHRDAEPDDYSGCGGGVRRRLERRGAAPCHRSLRLFQ